MEKERPEAGGQLWNSVGEIRASLHSAIVIHHRQSIHGQETPAQNTLLSSAKMEEIGQVGFYVSTESICSKSVCLNELTCRPI